MKKLKFLRVKDICFYCDCSELTAKRLKKDIAESVGLPSRLVTFYHLLNYLKIDANEFETSKCT